MTLGELFGAGFSLLRHAPAATFGPPFLAGVLSVALSALFLFFFPAGDMIRMMSDPLGFDDDEQFLAVFNDTGYILLNMASGWLQYLTALLGASLLVIPAMRAIYGFKTSLGQTLKLRASRIGVALLNLVILSIITFIAAFIILLAGILFTALTLGLGIILAFPGMLLAAAWLTSGFMYAPLVTLTERRGAFSAIARSWELGKGIRWKSIGTILLLFVIFFLVALIASLPILLLFGLAMDSAWQNSDPESMGTVAFVVFTVGSLINALLTAFFFALAGSFVSAMYINSRIHRESFDVAMLSAAEETHDDGTVLPGSVEHIGELPTTIPSPYGYSPYAGHAGHYGYPPQNPAPYTAYPGQGEPYSGQSQPGWGPAQPNWGPQATPGDPSSHDAGPDRTQSQQNGPGQQPDRQGYSEPRKGQDPDETQGYSGPHLGRPG